jgi:DNA polymerase III subunit delta
VATPISVALKDIENGKLARIYVVAGEEPFQAAEFAERLKKQFLLDAESFNYDVFDAESVAPADLLASLDTLPGLFDAPDSVRLVVCRRFEKAPATLLELLEPYWSNPAPQTCFLVFADKIDKRKAWVKEVEKSAVLIEVAEPYDRDWPKWRNYFEKRCGKAITPDAWEFLVQAASRSLSLIATECEKAALFVGESKQITLDSVREVSGAAGAEDIFQLSEDVVAGRSLAAMVKLQKLLLAGESEIKVLAILLRHFRQVAHCLQLTASGIKDPKVVGPQIGVPPFFVPKIQELSRLYTPEQMGIVLRRLADCDYRLKRGEGTLWADFLVPHFQRAPLLA